MASGCGASRWALAVSSSAGSSPCGCCRAGRGSARDVAGIDEQRPAARPLQTGDIVRGFLARFRLARLQERLPDRPVVAAFALINGFLSIAIMAVAALATGQPFVFPSLGPTAFLFFYTPMAPAASPRNAFIGHLIGAAAGFGCLLAFGLQDEGPATAVGVGWERVIAAALSLGLTSGVMILVNAPHPPAGATTLIISLGVLTEFEEVAVLMVAVVLLTMQAFAINRLAGLPYPVWSKPAPKP
ncbi:MAG: HPP family protein [Dehalococcoidia bacterium]|nr:HPP family protein [Dehalococcoidia bacterium]